MNIFEISFFGITISPTYYWLMYALSFISGYWIIKKRVIMSQWKKQKKDTNLLSSHTKFSGWDFMDSLLFHIFFGVVLWWRLWYVLFYNFSQYINDPFSILKVWEWWMSFHWWVIWVVIAMHIFAKRHKINYYSLADQVTAILPIWLWLGRIWNYLNKELLWFWEYFWPLAVKTTQGSFFPSPLVEFLLEWVILFIILNIIYKKRQFEGQIASLFLIWYWIFRIFVEIFFRTPDAHIGYILKYFTLWEIYSLPLICSWIYFYQKCKSKTPLHQERK